MKYITRNVKSEIRAESDAYAYQAAINSDGCITLRGTIRGLKGEAADETMLILSNSETTAIFKLLKAIEETGLFDDMPF